MDLLKLLNATGQQDQLIGTLASQFGLDSTQTAGAVSSIMGALSGGMQNKVKSQGAESVIQLAQSNQFQGYIDQPEQISNATNDGNNILGQLLGSKEASRQVATDIEQQSGISASIIKQMLPMVAAMAMGSINKQTDTGSSNQLTNMLTTFLDQDGDGSIIDDVLGMLSKKA